MDVTNVNSSKKLKKSYMTISVYVKKVYEENTDSDSACAWYLLRALADKEYDKVSSALLRDKIEDLYLFLFCTQGIDFEYDEIYLSISDAKDYEIYIKSHANYVLHNFTSYNSPAFAWIADGLGRQKEF